MRQRDDNISERSRMRPEDLEKRVEELEAEIASLRERTQRPPVGVRRRARWTIAEIPLYEISLGSDPGRREQRGHARAIIAIGDVASGVLAIGGQARGVVAIGGLAMGLFSIGGVSIGLLGAFGGLALGSLALGGAAAGGVAVGGTAAGYYACGAVSSGAYVLSTTQRAPEAEAVFRRYGVTAFCSNR